MIQYLRLVSANRSKRGPNLTGAPFVRRDMGAERSFRHLCRSLKTKMEVLFQVKKYDVRQLTLAAMVAALYAVMSYFGNIFGLTFAGIQFRFSEALCVLPFLFPATAPGLFIGCLITNPISPYGPLDIAVGSLATLLAALWTSKMPNKWLAPLPPVICNTVMVGFTIAFSMTYIPGQGLGEGFLAAWAIQGLGVGLGELGACYALGLLLLTVLPKIRYLKPMIAPARLS